MKKIVADTGPIIGLAKIGKLALLKTLVQEVLIPPTVYKELQAKLGSEAEEIDKALEDFIKVVEVKPVAPDIETVIARLDEGEKQAIALTLTIADKVLLLVDDRLGRAC